MTEAIQKVLEYWAAAGFLSAPIALCCFAFWAYYLRAHSLLAAAGSTPPGFEKEIESLMAPGLTGPAADNCAAPAGAAPCAAACAIASVERGLDPVESFERCEDDCFGRLDRDLPIMAALIAAAPLLGLLGTANGMIATFAAAGGASLEKTDLMASGIAHALLTTQLGLAVAIPGFFGLLRLRRMREQVETRLAACKVRLLPASMKPRKEAAP